MTVEFVFLAARPDRFGVRARRYVAAAGLTLAAAGFSVLCQWPALSSPNATMRAQTILTVAVTASFAGAAAVLHLGGERGGRPPCLFGAAVVRSISWSRAWEWGPLPALAPVAGAVFWVLVARACLGSPPGRALDRPERIYLRTLGTFLPLLTLTTTVTSRPGWRGASRDAWWPALFASRTAFGVVSYVGAIAALALAATFIWLVRRRVVRLAPLDRRVLGATGLTLAAAGVCAGLAGAFQVTHDGSSVFRLATTVALLGMPASFALGAVRKRFVRAQAAAVLARLADPPTMASVRAAFAEALGDPGVEVLYRLPSPPAGGGPGDGGPGDGGPGDGRPARGHPVHAAVSYVDGTGALARLPARHSGRLLVVVLARDRDEIAVISTDETLRRHRDLVEATVAAGGLALENARLQAILAHRLARVRDSRARIVETAMAERRRLEQDLHDGAQQRLLAVAARIAIARLHAGPHTTEIERAAEELHAALDELRGIARGIYPAVLADSGLAVALESAMDDFPMPVALDVPADRYDTATETAAYLTVIDLLTHAADLAGATRGTVRSGRLGDELWLEISHNGTPPPPAPVDTLLSAVDDRLRALDGRLELADGGRVRASIPCG